MLLPFVSACLTIDAVEHAERLAEAEGLPPADGAYEGEFRSTLSGPRGDDECSGAARLTLDASADPELHGTVECAFDGVYSGVLAGTLEGVFEADFASGVVFVTGGAEFGTTWSGPIEGERLGASFSGPAECGGVACVFDGQFAVRRVEP